MPPRVRGDVGRRPVTQLGQVGAGGGDVHVRVDQPGHHRHPGGVQDLGVAATDRRGRPRLRDAVAVDQDRLALDQRAGVGVQDGGVTEQDARGAHGWDLPSRTLARL